MKPLMLGWREWVQLPELGIDHIKAKVDTGARTSALHAYRVEHFTHNELPWVRFWVHPLQRNVDLSVTCEAAVTDTRVVRDSGGHEEERAVIKTRVVIGGHRRLIEVTLTDRDSMGFRMLLGRTALRRRFIVDPNRSYLLGSAP